MAKKKEDKEPTVPDQCEACDSTRFRQVGDKFVCKGCGHENDGK